jgi:hypothetical protein
MGAAEHVTPIRFEARLHRPANPRSATWSFLVLPADASARLPTRAMTTVHGRLGSTAFRATLEPDGHGSHWLKVPRALRESAGVQVGDTVAVELTPVAEVIEPRMPADLRKALAAAPAAARQWKALTPTARRDWIQWLDSAKQASTRERRVVNSCDMLEAGKRRVCCFDRSGMYSKAVAAPTPAE